MKGTVDQMLKSRVFKSRLLVQLTIFVLTVCLVGSSVVASYASNEELYRTPIKYSSNIDIMCGESYIMNMGSGVKVKNVGTYGRVNAGQADQKNKIYIEGYDTGTYKIEVLTNKKTYMINVNVHKYVNPFKRFNVGGKKYAARFSSNSDYTKRSVKSGKYKVNIKLKKGWKLQKIQFQKKNNNGSKSKRKTIKNGGRIRVKRVTFEDVIDGKGYYENVLIVKVYNKKSKISNTYTLTLDSMKY